MRRLFWTLIALAAAGGTLAAAAPLWSGEADATPASRETASVRARLVNAVRARRGGPVRAPTFGAYFGAWTSPNTGWTVAEREAQIGGRYKIVHNYHDWNDKFPDAEDIRWAKGRRILYIDWSSAIFGSSEFVSWSRIAHGREDAVIDAEARRIKAFRRPLLLSFFSEPESEIDQPAGRTVGGFAAAFRHIRNRFAADGVRNVSWVWSVMGSADYYDYYSGGLYPGDKYVDWIAWDPYNWYLCRGTRWQSFSQIIGGFYRWLVRHRHGNKPFMLSEWGSRESDIDPGAKGRWFTDARGAMRAGMFPNLKALVYFDSNRSECHWAIDTSPSSLAGYRAMAADPFFNP